MSFIFRSLAYGFSRTIGRIIAYLFIGLLIYFLISYLDIDISSIFPKINLGGFML